MNCVRGASSVMEPRCFDDKGASVDVRARIGQSFDQPIRVSSALSSSTKRTRRYALGWQSTAPRRRRKTHMRAIRPGIHRIEDHRRRRPCHSAAWFSQIRERPWVSIPVSIPATAPARGCGRGHIAKCPGRRPAARMGFEGFAAFRAVACALRSADHPRLGPAAWATDVGVRSVRCAA